METVHILAGADAGDHRLLVKMVGQRKLHENAVDSFIGIELIDQRKKGFLARVGCKPMFEALHARGQGRLMLAAHIDLAGRVLAH